MQTYAILSPILVGQVGREMLTGQPSRALFKDKCLTLPVKINVELRGIC
jgi:hypothetical protein